MPAAKPSDVRDIALVGHAGAGKTTLAEAMLFATKATTRLGSVNDGSSCLDYCEIEKKRKHTVDPALAYLDYNGKTINIIDTPGYPDFVGTALTAMSGADTAVLCISATAGIETNSRRMLRATREMGMPLAIVITKIDSEGVDFPELMGMLSDTFGHGVHPMNLPTGGGTGVIDCFANAEGEADYGNVAEIHTQIIESVIESDEEMMEAYLGDEEIPAEKLAAAFGQAMVDGLIPIFFTASVNGAGVEELLASIAKFLPAPGMVPGAPVMDGEGEEASEIPVEADPDKPFIGQAFKITTDPFVGKMAWIRILQGTAAPDTHYHLHGGRKTAKIGHAFKVLGDKTTETKMAVAGEIIALAKVEDISAGDVLHAEGKERYRAMPKTPTPMYSLAVTPKKRGDEQKISESLHRLTDEDPTFILRVNSQTHETVIDGLGDLHVRMMLAKMKNRFHIEVDTHPPKIAYRETISMPADGHHRHKKQTGGAGQFGEVYLRVEPKERGWTNENGPAYEMASELFGESIPRQYLPAIEKGISDVCLHGAIAGYPMQDIHVAVTDGKHHPVDSKEVAFKAAGKWAFIDAVKKAKPVLLEPLVDMEITVPADKMGDIASDLSGRRGRIQGQVMLPGNIVCVEAQAPLSEVMQYNSSLKSITGGQGSFTMEFSHYEPVPGNVQKQIVDAAGKREEAE